MVPSFFGTSRLLSSSEPGETLAISAHLRPGRGPSVALVVAAPGHQPEKPAKKIVGFKFHHKPLVFSVENDEETFLGLLRLVRGSLHSYH